MIASHFKIILTVIAKYYFKVGVFSGQKLMDFFNVFSERLKILMKKYINIQNNRLTKILNDMFS